MCNDKFRYLKHRYLLSEQYRRVYGTTDGGLKQADRHSPSAGGGGQDENSIRAPHFIYGNEFNHLFGTDLDTLQNVFLTGEALTERELYLFRFARLVGKTPAFLYFFVLFFCIIYFFEFCMTFFYFYLSLFSAKVKNKTCLLRILTYFMIIKRFSLID